MRVALTIAIATLTLGLGSQSLLAQEDVHNDGLRSIHMLDALTGWAVTLGGAMLRTTDGGTHWADVTPLNPSGKKITVHTSHVRNSLIAWAAPDGSSTPQVFRTVDGGRTWKSTKVSDFGVNAIQFVNQKYGWSITDGVAFMGGNEEANIYRSTDGGETWIRVASACIQSSPICKHTPDSENSGLPLHGFKTNITFLNTESGWVTGTILYATHDSGRTWQEQKLTLPPGVVTSWQGQVYSPPMFFTAQEGLLPVFYFGGESTSSPAVAAFYASRDGGGTWKHSAPISITKGYLDCWHYICGHYRPSSFADMNHGWMADGGTLYVTSNGGREWTVVRPLLFANVKHLDFISPEVGWAVRITTEYVGGKQIPTPPFLLKTLDGGRTWSPVTYTILR